MIRRPPRSTLFPSPTLSRSINLCRRARRSLTGAVILAALAAGLLAPLTTHATVHRDRLQILVWTRSEEHTSELQSHSDLVCRLLLEKKKKNKHTTGAYQSRP